MCSMSISVLVKVKWHYLKENVISAGRFEVFPSVVISWGGWGAELSLWIPWWHNSCPTLNLPSLSSNGVPVSPKWTELTGSRDLSSIVIMSCFHSSIDRTEIKIINQSLSVYFSWLSDLIEGLLQHIYMQPCLDRTLASLHYCPPTIHSQIIVTFCIHNSHFADI